MFKRLSEKSLLLGALVVLTACVSSGEGEKVEDPPPVLSQQWTASVFAGNAVLEAEDDSQEDGEGDTRALFWGGNSGNRFARSWDQGDVVYVYRDGSLNTTPLGTMTPNSAYWGLESGTLEGTLAGPFTVNQTLVLYCPGKAMDFTGQTGTIQSASGKSYRYATTTVTQAADQILSLSNVTMSERVTYGRFILTDETTGARLHPSRLVIHALVGPDPVLTTDESGVPVTRGDIDINCVVSDGEYPGELFVSMYKETESFKYVLRATIGEDTYIGPLVGQNPIQSQSGLGSMLNYRRKMRKATMLSTLIIDPIPDQTFTGYPIEPVAVVRDGATLLTADTDYMMQDFENNVNVGLATCVVRGMADALPQAATKYLGTETVNFNILKATPVIDISTETMALVVGHESETRAVSRVFIDNNGNGTWDAGVDYDITDQCVVNYESNNTGVAIVGVSTGVVSAAEDPTIPTTATITVSVPEADNWTSASVQYTVNVETEVNGQNSVNDWNNIDTEGGKIYILE